MMTGHLILTIGLPGSGKSTWARQQADAVVIERDALREELTGDMRNHTQEPRVTREANRRVFDALEAGKTVIVADTNLRAKYRKAWQQVADDAGATYAVESFLHVPVDVCIERDAQRPNPVGEEVIRRMHQVATSGN